MPSFWAGLLWLGLAVAGAVAAEAEIAGNPLVAVGGGTFVFGDDAGPENERPRRVLDLPPFLMNRTEVTNAQYRRFVAETGHRPSFYDTHPLLGGDDRPVVGVSWSDAEDFCRHYGLSLPSEQQFERAARGTDGARFPWGAAPSDASRGSGGADICCGSDEGDGFALTAPVGSFPAGRSPNGIDDLIGNVWEWTRDWYSPYSGGTNPATAQRFRVLRGGGWNSDPAKLSATYRLAFDPDFRFAANGGFRCVHSSG
jgi:iron(II)-dependent oxidoreductase